MASILIHIFLILIVLFLGEDLSRSCMGYIYIIQYIFYIYTLNKKNKEKLLTPYLRPSFLIVTYACLYFGFGSMYINGEHGMFTEMSSFFFNVKNFQLINIFFIICNYIIFKAGDFALKKNNKISVLYENYHNNNINNYNKFALSTVFISVFIFLFFTFFELDFSILGGDGSFSYIPKIVSSIIIIIYLASQKKRIRFLFYFLLLMLFALVSFQSKREIIFILILIIFIENMFNPIKFNINLRSFFKGVFVFLGFMFFIVTSSINRGYGEYSTTDIIDAIQYVPDYIQSDIFIDAVGDNLELSFVYANALNAADMYISGSQETLYGETFFKVFFLPFSKTIFNYKPQSMISLYSPRVYTGKDVYVTFPVLVYVEALWNFGIFFIPILYFISYIADNLFYKIQMIFYTKGPNVLSVVLLVFYTIYIQFIRGSGLDLLFLYILVSVPFTMFIMKVNSLLRK